MNMSDLPALPKAKKPLNRQLYDLAWLPFAVMAELVQALMVPAKAGFLLSGILAAIGAGISFMNNDLSLERMLFLAAVFVGMGIMLTVALSLLAALGRLFR